MGWLKLFRDKYELAEQALVKKKLTVRNTVRGIQEKEIVLKRHYLRPDEHLTYADSGSAGATIDTVCSLISN